MKLKNLKNLLVILGILQAQPIFAYSNSNTSDCGVIQEIKEANVKNINNDGIKEVIDFYMFASFSLSDTTLRQMIDYAKIYNGIIVFRGIKENSFVKTSSHKQKLVEEGASADASIVIDPILFKKYEISQVPTYVIAKHIHCPAGMNCLKKFDKIIGNITPTFALEKFAEKGDLSEVALKLLERK